MICNALDSIRLYHDKIEHKKAQSSYLETDDLVVRLETKLDDNTLSEVEREKTCKELRQAREDRCGFKTNVDFFKSRIDNNYSLKGPQ